MTTIDAIDIEALAAFGAWVADRRHAITAPAGVAEMATETQIRLIDYVLNRALAGVGYASDRADGLATLLRTRVADAGEEIQLHSFVDELRGQLVEIALDALSAGVSHARSGLHVVLRQIDSIHLEISQFYQGLRATEMREMHTRLDQILATTPLSSVEWSKDGTVVRWNPAAERIFGWSATEAIGRNIVELLVPDVALDQVQAIVQALLSGAGGTSSRNLNIRKDGKLITCQWYNAVLRDDHGEVVGALSQTEDVTEELRAEEALRESQEQLIMSLRELSTPLIPLDAGVVAMPLIGAIDSTRAQQVIETLLDGVSTHHARVAILDITGVSVVDTQVANALIRAAQAVKLLGARVILTGIRPEVAQTLVGLGVDLTGIITRSSLQAGIAYAMGR
jgi:PAS domain S-box-containing protein